MIAGTALLLGACAPVRVAVAAPTITTAVNQQTYCTTGPTRVDFALGYRGNVSRVEAYAVPAGSGAPTRANPGQFVGGTEDVFTFGSGQITGSFLFQPQQAGQQAPAATAPNVAQALSIVVNPVQTYDLYFRAFSVTGDSTRFVRGQRIVPDSTRNCDPNIRY